ncbi:PH domain-containing protein [Nocardioides jensenii]|uniref:PH domain-containing protein n=1 Tax=Nocardioides jensenii TaxID=1843 RepID=UPI000A59E41E|nr:PH domain-containing protein [Nocardioides jensenii]
MTVPVSDLTLPHTWRPLGVRMAGIAGSIMLLVLCGAAWFLLDAEVRATFDLFQRVTALLLGVFVGALVHALIRARAVASVEGLLVVNGYKSRFFEWAEIVAIHLPRGAPWATLDLADGTTCAVMALQGTDGARATQAVREIRALLA